MEPVFSTDRVPNAFSTVDSDGVSVSNDSDGVTVDFNWSTVEQVTVDAPPHEHAFDTDQFYRIQGVTLARPIMQLYKNRDGDIVQRQKPADELQDAAWTFDNAPYTLGHPDTGVVKRVSDIHGFYRNPRYDTDEEALLEDLYVPVGDAEAMEYIEESQDVSIGFYNERTPEYDGNTGSLTDDSPDEYQVNLYGDHVASVPRGRCPSEAGCGIPTADHSEYSGMDWDETTSVLTKKDQTMQQGSWVTWEDGAAHGKIDEIIRDGCTTRGLGDMEVCAKEDDPAVVVEVYDDETGESKDEFVRHLMSTLNSWSGPSNDAMDMTPPQAAQDNAQQVLDWDDEGMVPDSCGTDAGWTRAEQLADGEELSWDTIGRMSMFNRHRSNSGVDEGEEPHTDCGHVMWLAWGGDAGVDWAMDMMDNKESMDMIEPMYEEGDMVHWQGFPQMRGRVVHLPDNENIAMVELMEEVGGELQKSGFTVKAGYTDVVPMNMSMDEYMEGDKYYAIGPDENPDDEPKYPINNCNDATDAWNLRGAGDYDIEQSTLEERIKDRAQELDCELPSTANMEDDSAVTEQYNTDYYTNRDTKMNDSDTFDISVSVDRDSVTVDSLAEQFDAVADLKAEYDSLQTSMDEMREELDLEADECPCDHVADLKAEADEADELREQLDEYRQSEKEDRLDRLVELNADRDEWEDEDLDEIEAEIDRREDIFEDIDFSVKNADGGDGEESDSSSTSKGRRRFGRGYNA
jgi:hypothetical protein